jgi:hypothetical protein
MARLNWRPGASTRADLTGAKLTAATITDRDIRMLAAEANHANDDLQATICAVALSGGLGEITDVEPHRSALEVLGIIPEHVDADIRARQLCADAINSARAQDEDEFCPHCGETPCGHRSGYNCEVRS